MLKRLVILCLMVSGLVPCTVAQDPGKTAKPRIKLIYGTASFYANKFDGRKTANGEIFSQQNLTAAGNLLPLGTWIKVTNLRNGRAVIVRINDRLHPRMKRIVDLSRTAAQQLNYLRSGLTKVKVEVLPARVPPAGKK